MSFHDPFNAFVYYSNQCDVIPSKNSRNKSNHFTVVLNPIPIQVFLYSFKNTSGSSPLLPIKAGITMLIFILFYLFIF